MKKRKVLAVLVALLLVVGAGVYTYARYITTKAGSGDVEVAKWTATVKQGGTAVTDDFTLGLTLSENAYVANGKIAPARSATATLVVDLTGTEVATDIEVDLGSVTGLPTGMTISGVTANGAAMTKTGNVYSTTVDLNAAKTAISSNTVTLVITATWDNASDAYNANDTGFGDGTNDADWTLQIPVTVTAKQHIGA